MSGSIRWSRLLLCGLFVCACAPVRAAPPAVPDAAAFDQLLTLLDNGDIEVNTSDAVDQKLARLHALMPPHDVSRQLRYENMVCFMTFSNDVNAGYAYAGEGLVQARQAGDREAEANFHYCRGQYHEMVSTPHDALPDYEAGIQLARKLENSRLVADGFTWRGSALSLIGEQALALRDFLEAQQHYQTTGLTAAAEANLTNIAVSYRRLGEYDKASEYFKQAKVFAERRNNKPSLLIINLQMGFLLTERGDPAGALAPLRQALALARETGARQSIGATLLALAEASNKLSRYVEALDQVARAKVEFDAVSDRSNMAMLTLQSAEAHAGLGERALAASEFDVAEASVRASGNMRYMVELYDERAKNQEALGNSAAALKYLKLKVEADAALARMTQTQYATLMSYQFETARSELENRKLAADKLLQDQQLVSLERIRRWQGLTILLGGVLLLLVIGLALRQFRQSRGLRRLAMTDALTGIANRRHIEKIAHRVMLLARSASEQMAVLVFDVDSFKRINDTYGHPVGDQVLVRVVDACKEGLRQFDRVGRVGGEEFLVILPRTGIEAGRQVAERLRANVNALDFEDIAPGLKVSISLGVAHLGGASESLEGLIQRADQALYRAKKMGRDRVELATP